MEIMKAAKVVWIALHSLVDFRCRLRNESGMSPLFKEIERHLEFHGYKVVYDQGILKTTHTTKPRFWVHPSLNGALFIAMFALGKKQDIPAILQFVNNANLKIVVGRFTVEPDVLAVSAWFPNCYEKAAFSEFFDQYLLDINWPMANDRETVQKLFWDEPSSATPAIPES